MKIDAQTVLPVGSRVEASCQRGEVIASKMVPEATGNGLVCSHQIRFTHKLRRYGAGRSVWEEMKKPQTRGVNYSFIRTID